jgi:NAD(P)-dependent dehydrogenase (short-subunit alcohol dehydrogenase family)
MLLNGKIAIITGAGSGVGRASALRFAEEGARVACADRRFETAKETVRLIEEAGGTAVAVACDVTQEEQVAQMVATTVDQFGRLDIIFNNAGIPAPRLTITFEEHTVEEFDLLVAVNLRGVFLGCKHAVLQFKDQGDGGVILNTGSVSGLVGWQGTPYGATKGAVHQLTRAIAIECAPLRIRANAICPGGMPLTNFLAAGGVTISDGHIDALTQATGVLHPLGRIITAEDCAEAAVYLCSDRADNITGVLLPIDGGYVAR